MSEYDKIWTEVRLKLKYWFKEPKSQKDLKIFIETADAMIKERLKNK